MDPMDIGPTPKRRRTSADGSDYSSRSTSRDRNAKRSASGNARDGNTRRRYSSSRSPGDGRDNNRRSSYHGRSRSRSRSQSTEYNTPRSRSLRRSFSRSRSDTPVREDRDTPKTSQSLLSFKFAFVLPHAHARGITTVKFSPDHTLLATGSADATINIYRVPSQPSAEDDGEQAASTFKLVRTLRGHLAGVNALCWSPIGPPYTLASASDDKTIFLWSPLSSDLPIPPSPLTGHSNYVYSLAFSPKGNMLVSGSYDEAVFLWDVRSARVMRSLPAHSDPVSGVDFIRDGTMVCSCASDGLIRIWDSGTGQCLKTLVDEDRKPVTAVRFSPNGRFVLAWTLDDSIRLWNYMSTESACVKTYQGHVNRSYSLSGSVGDYPVIDPETGMERREAFVASGSEDGDVVVWDVSSKEILWRGKGHKDVVLAVDFGRTKDGRALLASAGKDRYLRIWIEDAEPRLEDVMLKHEDAHDEMDIDGHVVRMEMKREDDADMEES